MNKNKQKLIKCKQCKGKFDEKEVLYFIKAGGFYCKNCVKNKYLKLFNNKNQKAIILSNEEYELIITLLKHHSFIPSDTGESSSILLDKIERQVGWNE